MASLSNKVTLIGRLGANAEQVNLENSQKTRISLATSESYKDKEGNWQDIIQWHNVVGWGKVAEKMATLEKGSEVLIGGKLVNRSYETKTGEKRYTTEVEVSEFLVLNNPNK